MRRVVCFSSPVCIYICKCDAMHANEIATNWNKKQHHIDIWIDSTDFDEGGKVMDCENTLTPKHGIRVIRNPGEKFRVVGMYLYSACGVGYIIWMLTMLRGTVISGRKVLYRACGL